jgi:hypothetical protein
LMNEDNNALIGRDELLGLAVTWAAPARD